VCANAAFGGANAALVFARDTIETHPHRTEPRALSLSGVGAVQDWSRLHQSVPLAELRGLDATARLLASAVTTALIDAKLRLRSKDCEAIGLFVGQTRVSPESYRAFGKSIHERGLAHLSASAFTRMVVNNATGVCCRLFGLKGPSATLATGSDSGLTALVLGANHLAWRDDVNRLLTAAVDEPGQSDCYDNAAACVLLEAQDNAAPVSLVAWALASDRETAVAQALARARRNREEVTSMVVSGPPASATLRAVVTAINAIRKGESGPFLISDCGEGSAGAAIILEARSRR
jgi:3-oxoacyl-(acyl-carrier-protein) synthase